jgi:hypothetical protein
VIGGLVGPAELILNAELLRLFPTIEVRVRASVGDVGEPRDAVVLDAPPRLLRQLIRFCYDMYVRLGVSCKCRGCSPRDAAKRLLFEPRNFTWVSAAKTLQFEVRPDCLVEVTHLAKPNDTSRRNVARVSRWRKTRVI